MGAVDELLDGFLVDCEVGILLILDDATSMGASHTCGDSLGFPLG